MTTEIIGDEFVSLNEVGVDIDNEKKVDNNN
jgi:hypothetical protein